MSADSAVVSSTLDSKGARAYLNDSLTAPQTIAPLPRVCAQLAQLTAQEVTDAAQLMREHGETENVKQTAWNNRLAALTSLGLVVELSAGRAKKYRALFEEA